jgi:hypothetical protein
MKHLRFDRKQDNIRRAYRFDNGTVIMSRRVYHHKLRAVAMRRIYCLFNPAWMCRHDCDIFTLATIPPFGGVRLLVNVYNNDGFFSRIANCTCMLA